MKKKKIISKGFADIWVIFGSCMTGVKKIFWKVRWKGGGGLILTHLQQVRRRSLLIRDLARSCYKVCLPVQRKVCLFISIHICEGVVWKSTGPAYFKFSWRAYAEATRTEVPWSERHQLALERMYLCNVYRTKLKQLGSSLPQAWENNKCTCLPNPAHHNGGAHGPSLATKLTRHKEA